MSAAGAGGAGPGGAGAPERARAEPREPEIVAEPEDGPLRIRRRERPDLVGRPLPQRRWR